METVILANGAPPTHSVPRAHLCEATELICCDGACRAARALGREPDFVVGDGDSLAAADRAALGARFVRIAEQDVAHQVVRDDRAYHAGAVAVARDEFAF